MSEQSDSDFEKACAAYWRDAHESFGSPPWSELSKLPRRDVRRGLLAALRQMREPNGLVTSGLVSHIGKHERYKFEPRLVWQAMIEELIRQGEQEAGNPE